MPKAAKKRKIPKGPDSPSWEQWKPHMLAEANNYVDCGNREYYSRDNLQKRAALRYHPMVKQALQGFWKLLEKGSAVQNGRLSRDKYRHEYAKTRQALAPQMPEDLFEQSMIIDFLSDCNMITKSAVDNDEKLSRRQFFDSIFELADLWTCTLDPAEYASFITMLEEHNGKEYREAALRRQEDLEGRARAMEREMQDAAEAREREIQRQLQAQLDHQRYQEQKERLLRDNIAWWLHNMQSVKPQPEPEPEPELQEESSEEHIIQIPAELAARIGLILARLRDDTGQMECLLTWQNGFRAEQRRLKEERRRAAEEAAEAERRRREEEEAERRRREAAEAERRRSVSLELERKQSAESEKEASRKSSLKSLQESEASRKSSLKSEPEGEADEEAEARRLKQLADAKAAAEEAARLALDKKLATLAWVLEQARSVDMHGRTPTQRVLQTFADRYFDWRRMWIRTWHGVHLWSKTAMQAYHERLEAEELERVRREKIARKVMLLKAELEKQDALDKAREQAEKEAAREAALRAAEDAKRERRRLLEEEEKRVEAEKLAKRKAETDRIRRQREALEREQEDRRLAALEAERKKYQEEDSKRNAARQRMIEKQQRECDRRRKKVEREKARLERIEQERLSSKLQREALAKAEAERLKLQQAAAAERAELQRSAQLQQFFDAVPQGAGNCAKDAAVAADVMRIADRHQGNSLLTETEIGAFVLPSQHHELAEWLLADRSKRFKHFNEAHDGRLSTPDLTRAIACYHRGLAAEAAASESSESAAGGAGQQQHRIQRPYSVAAGGAGQQQQQHRIQRPYSVAAGGAEQQQQQQHRIQRPAAGGAEQQQQQQQQQEDWIQRPAAGELPSMFDSIGYNQPDSDTPNSAYDRVVESHDPDRPFSVPDSPLVIPFRSNDALLASLDTRRRSLHSEPSGHRSSQGGLNGITGMKGAPRWKATVSAARRNTLLNSEIQMQPLTHDGGLFTQGFQAYNWGDQSGAIDQAPMRFPSDLQEVRTLLAQENGGSIFPDKPDTPPESMPPHSAVASQLNGLLVAISGKAVSTVTELCELLKGNKEHQPFCRWLRKHCADETVSLQLLKEALHKFLFRNTPSKNSSPQQRSPSPARLNKRKESLPSFTSDWSLRRYSKDGSTPVDSRKGTACSKQSHFCDSSVPASRGVTRGSERSGEMLYTAGIPQAPTDRRGRLLLALTDLIPKDTQKQLVSDVSLQRAEHGEQLAQLMATHILNASDKMSRNRLLTVVELQTFLQGGSPFEPFYHWLMEGSMTRFRSFDPNQNGALGQQELEVACRQFLLQLSSSHGISPVEEMSPSPTPWVELHSPPYIEGPNTQSLTDFGLFFRQPNTPLSRAGTRAACKRPRISRAACRTPMPVTPEHRAQFGDFVQAVPPIIACPQTPQRGSGEDLALQGSPVTETSIWLAGSNRVTPDRKSASPPRACKVNLRNPWAALNEPTRNAEQNFHSVETAHGHTFGDDVTNDAYPKQAFSPARSKELPISFGDHGWNGDGGELGMSGQTLEPLIKQPRSSSVKASMISVTRTSTCQFYSDDIFSSTPQPSDRSHHQAELVEHSVDDVYKDTLDFKPPPKGNNFLSGLSEDDGPGGDLLAGFRSKLLKKSS